MVQKRAWMCIYLGLTYNELIDNLKVQRCHKDGRNYVGTTSRKWERNLTNSTHYSPMWKKCHTKSGRATPITCRSCHLVTRRLYCLESALRSFTDWSRREACCFKGRWDQGQVCAQYLFNWSANVRLVRCRMPMNITWKSSVHRVMFSGNVNNMWNFWMEMWTVYYRLSRMDPSRPLRV